MPKFMITTISTFIHKYAIEADSAECATKEWNLLDEGEYETEYPDCCEISQLHAGEQIVKVDEVTDDRLVLEADEYQKEFVLSRIRKAPYQDNRGFVE
jgi:hypothetical protein